jgi:hypothetical protein
MLYPTKISKRIPAHQHSTSKVHFSWPLIILAEVYNFNPFLPINLEHRVIPRYPAWKLVRGADLLGVKDSLLFGS